MKGIYEVRGRYNARIQLFGKTINLGTFYTLDEALEMQEAFRCKYSVAYKPVTDKYFGLTTSGHMFQARFKGAYLGQFETIGEAAEAINAYIIKNDISHHLIDIKIDDIIAANRAKAKRRKQVKEHDMERPRIRQKHGPEYYIQQDIRKFLELRGWIVRVISAGLHNIGLPDLLGMHKKYGLRLIEVKNPASFSFTSAQYKWYPIYCKNGGPVYIMTGANEENYARLFRSSNLWIYMAGLSDGK